MEIAIKFGLFLGVYLCLIPLVIIIEIYHCLNKETRMKRPYLFSVITSSILAVVVISVFMIRSSNEGDLGIILISPLILIGFATEGVLVGCLYEVYGRTITEEVKKRINVFLQ